MYNLQVPNTPRPGPTIVEFFDSTYQLTQRHRQSPALSSELQKGCEITDSMQEHFSVHAVPLAFPFLSLVQHTEFALTGFR